MYFKAVVDLPRRRLTTSIESSESAAPVVDIIVHEKRCHLPRRPLFLPDEISREKIRWERAMSALIQQVVAGYSYPQGTIIRSVRRTTELICGEPKTVPGSVQHAPFKSRQCKVSRIFTEPGVEKMWILERAQSFQ